MDTAMSGVALPEGENMDDSRIDRIARRLARRQFSRRAALGATGASLTAMMFRGSGTMAELARAEGTPAPQGTPGVCPADGSNDFEFDGAWLCNQPYALCTTAPCEPSASDPSTAICRCVVLNGYSIGYTSCDERIPSKLALISTFSTENVTSAFGIMTCPESARWANCLDMPCEIDSLNPAQATCSCPIVESGPSMVFGGGCDTSTCASVIWSGATPPGVTQYTAAMQCVNRAVTFPEICPSGTPTVPAASPAAA
jgi:hypothetical protein